MKNKKNSTLAAFIHLSTFSKYFLPFGNFIFPLIIWVSGKKEAFIEHHGREALNFQISTFLYFVLLMGISASVFLFMVIGQDYGDPFFLQGELPLNNLDDAFPFIVLFIISGILLLALFILELVCVITAAIKAGDGQEYHYPISIPFLRNTKDNINSNNIQNESI